MRKIREKRGRKHGQLTLEDAAATDQERALVDAGAAEAPALAAGHDRGGNDPGPVARPRRLLHRTLHIQVAVFERAI